jgi:enamine deaminase RidA (YjgF/YER057c/UK114 family)
VVQRMTVPGLFPPPDYAHLAVVAAGERLVFTAGGVPLDAEGTLVGPGDPVAQTRQVLANLAAALRAGGTDLRHVIASTVYVVGTTPAELDAVWVVVSASDLAADPAGQHTSTLLGVSCLGYTGQLVEITAVAVLPT